MSTEENDGNIVNEIVMDDGDTQMMFWLHEGLAKMQAFSLVVRDGGGYSSLLVTKNCWEKFKQEVE